MFTAKNFANKFSEEKLCLVFFNEYNSITQQIDKDLSNLELFTVTQEYEKENVICFRCNIKISVDCPYSVLLDEIVDQYKKAGWRISYTGGGIKKILHFQAFVEFNKETKKCTPMEIETENFFF